jgi:UDP-2-acetamido-3-amino-2,3-dideoxy-glucuronate N-acetyltransferase
MTDSTYFAHESSYIDEGARVGAGTKIWHFSHIMSGAVVGEDCNFGQNVVVSPDCIIGRNVKIQNNVSVYTGVELEDDVFCGPSMVFTNVINPRSHINRKSEYRRTLVRVGASIGANATIVCGITLGRYCFIGAGSVVTRDVPDYGLIVGNPGRLRGYVCYCGEKLDLPVVSEPVFSEPVFSEVAVSEVAVPEPADSKITSEVRCSACQRVYRQTGGAVAEI